MDNYLFTEQDKNGYKIIHDSQLMKNYQAADIVNTTVPIKVAHDFDGHPIVLRLEEKRLKIIYHDEKSGTGWSEMDFIESCSWGTDAIYPETSILAYDILQDDKQHCLFLGMYIFQYTPKGRIPGAGINSYILIKLPLNSGFKSPKSWIKKDISTETYIWSPTVSPKSIHLAPDPDSSWPLSFKVWGESQFNITQYIRKQYTRPVGEDQHQKEQHTWALLKQENCISYEFHTFPGKVGQNTRTISVLVQNIGKNAASPEGTYLYYFDLLSQEILLEGPGLKQSNNIINLNNNPYVFICPNWDNLIKNSSRVINLGGDFPKDIKQSPTDFEILNDFIHCGSVSTPYGLDIGVTPKTIAAWALDNAGNLHHSIGRSDDLKIWSPTVQLATNVIQFAALPNKITGGNDAVYVKSDGSVNYLYQDATTSLWNTEPIHFPHQENVVEFTSYTTEITLLKENPVLPHDFPLELELSASEQQYVIVNNCLHRIGPTNPVKVQTDHLGKITIVNRTESLATPEFTIKFSNGEVALIDPAFQVKAKLNKIKSGDDLTKIKVTTGKNGTKKPLVSDSKQAHPAAQAIHQLHHLAEKMQENSTTLAAQPSSSAVGYFGVIDGEYRDGKEAASTPSGLRLNVFSDGAHWLGSGLHHLEHGGKVFLHHMEDDGKSILEGIEKELKKAGDWVIKELDNVAHFVINIAGKVFKFVIKVATEVFHVICWLCKNMLGIDLEDMIAWLGFIFDWDDMLLTAQVSSRLFSFYFDQVKDRLKGVEKEVQAGAKELKEKIESLNLPDIGSRTTRSSSKDKDSSVAHSAPAKFLLNHFKDNAKDIKIKRGSVTTSTERNKKIRAISDKFVKKKDEKQPDLVNKRNDLIKLIHDTWSGSEGEADPSWEVGLEKILKDIAVEAIDLFVEIVDDLLDLFIEVVDIVQNALKKDELSEGIISSILKKIAPNFKPSLLDIILLIGTVPGTVVYKLKHDKSPFSKDDPFTKAILDAKNYKEFRDKAGMSFAADSHSAISEDVLNILTGCGSIIFGIGGILKTILEIVEEETEGETPGLTMSIAVLDLAGDSNDIFNAVLSTKDFTDSGAVDQFTTILTDLTIIGKLVFRVLPSSFEDSEGEVSLEPISEAIDTTLALPSLALNVYSMVDTLVKNQVDIASDTTAVLDGLSGILANLSTIIGYVGLVDEEEITKEILIAVKAILGVEASLLGIASGTIQLVD